jgi:hypothetical protein
VLCLYQAEKLQEKGQLKLALLYFKKVLDSSPDCFEAQENARITREILAGEEDNFKQNGLESISEDKISKTGSYTTTEMEIEWSGSENYRIGYYPEPDQLVVGAATPDHLRKSDQAH